MRHSLPRVGYIVVIPKHEGNSAVMLEVLSAGDLKIAPVDIGRAFALRTSSVEVPDDACTCIFGVMNINVS